MAINLPEILRFPKMIFGFVQGGVSVPMLGEILFSKSIKPRNFVEDMRLFFKGQEVVIDGIENIPKTGGGLIIINHPNLSIIFPAICKIPIAIKDQLKRDDVALLIGLRLKLIVNIDFPGSAKAIKRFFEFYPDHLLQVPGNRSAPDYETGRQRVKDEIQSRLEGGKLIILSPEASISVSGSLLPTRSYRYGAGEVGVSTSILDVPIIPTGIWLDNNIIKVKIGKPFYLPITSIPKDAVIHMMGQVAKQIPDSLRGPYTIKPNTN